MTVTSTPEDRSSAPIRNPKTGWLGFRFVDDGAVCAVRDAFYEWLGEPEPYDRELDPHVSLFGITVPESHADPFERAVQTFTRQIGDRSAAVRGYHLWPSSRNPMVVSLSIDFPATDVASPVADLLAEHGGQIRWGPRTPHVTLFKGDVRGEELQWAQVPSQIRAKIRAVAEQEDPRGLSPPAVVSSPAFDLEVRPVAVEW